MFAIVAVPFDAFRSLPSPQHRWLLTCLCRYSDKTGKCWPNMRQLADDARMSLSTVCRRLREMDDLAVFHRERQGRGRYVYTLTEAYRPRWPKPEGNHRAAGECRPDSAAPPGVSGTEQRVSQAETQKANPPKHDKILPDDRQKWGPRLRGWTKRRFWLPLWGPRPDEHGCFVPAGLLRSQLGEDRSHAS